MKAVVMAGGEGTRLRPLTVGRPKPMVSVVNRPCLEHVLLLLKRHGITEVVITLQYLADVIQSYFGDGSHMGMRIDYSIEDQPLGTAGSVRLAADRLEDTVLVISGDALTDCNLTDLVGFHRRKGAMVTITLHREPNPLEYGVVITDEDGRIRQFQEKPSWGEVISDTINTGIYVLEPTIFDYIEPGRMVDFSQDVFPRLLTEGKPLFGSISDAYWTDIGTIQEYMRANRDVLEGRVQVEMSGTQLQPRVWCEDDAEIAESAHLEPPLYIGREVRIRGGADIHGPTVIRDNCVIESHAQIDGSIIWRGSYIGQRAEVRGAVIGRECSIHDNAVIFENAVVADHSTIGSGAIVHSNVKIWPHKEVEAGASVRTSLVWGAQGRRSLFGRHGVSGLVNVDFTPEFMAQLGAAYGATLPKGSSVTVNRDLNPPSRMLTRALTAGLASAGISALDLGSVPVPVARYYTRMAETVGGIDVRLQRFNHQVAELQFMNARGLTIDKRTERKIENTFFREDFRRASIDEFGTIHIINDAVDRYSAAFKAWIEREPIAQARPTLVIDFASSPSASVLPPLLDALGCEVVALNANPGPDHSTAEGLARARNRLTLITATVRADLGAMFDPTGEMLSLTDGSGRILDDLTTLAALAELVLRFQPDGIIAVPVTVPRAFEIIAQRHGGTLIYTKVDRAALANAALGEGVVLAGDGQGLIMLPHIHPAFDAMLVLAKLLELLERAQTTLQAVVADLPPWHIRRTQVLCAWDQKGRVMRVLGEQYRQRRARPIDGVKIMLDGDWVLVLPDSERPVLHVIAEASSDDQAEALSEKYAAVVTSLQR
jgi:mannose-1-phosphate guanylyltransferase/phosphomannomutase